MLLALAETLMSILVIILLLIYQGGKFDCDFSQPQRLLTLVGPGDKRQSDIAFL